MPGQQGGGVYGGSVHLFEDGGINPRIGGSVCVCVWISVYGRPITVTMQQSPLPPHLLLFSHSFNGLLVCKAHP